MRIPALAACALLLSSVGAAAAPEGPPYYDHNRGIEKQRDAEKQARSIVKKGTSQLEPVLMSLADDSAYVRDGVVAELVDSWTGDDLAVLAKGLQVKDPFIAAGVAEVLGLAEAKNTRQQLEEALRRHKDDQVLVMICWALARIGDPASWQPLQYIQKKADDESVLKGEATRAMALCDPARAPEFLKEQLGTKQRSPTARLAAMLSLSQIDEVEGAKAARDALVDDGRRIDEDWRDRVLFQACEILRATRNRTGMADVLREAVGAAIERLAKAEGRPQHELGWTLRELTGKAIGDDASSWQAFWQAKKSTFEFKDPEKDHAPGDSEEAGGGGRGSVLRYFNIPIYSKRLTFMLDLSGGMDRPLGGQGDDSPPRITIAKEELKKTLEKLPRDTYVNVLFFASQYYAAAPRLVPVGKLRGKLIQYVAEQTIPTKVHSNRGNIYCTLRLALEQPTIDTVFMLSEGNPTEGQFIDRDRFLRHLQILNRYSKTRIHALFIGSAKSAERYLRAVAEEGGNGKFYDVREMR